MKFIKWKKFLKESQQDLSGRILDIDDNKESFEQAKKQYFYKYPIKKISIKNIFKITEIPSDAVVFSTDERVDRYVDKDGYGYEQFKSYDRPYKLVVAKHGQTVLSELYDYGFRDVQTGKTQKSLSRKFIMLNNRTYCKIDDHRNTNGKTAPFLEASFSSQISDSYFCKVIIPINNSIPLSYYVKGYRKDDKVSKDEFYRTLNMMGRCDIRISDNGADDAQNNDYRFHDLEHEPSRENKYSRNPKIKKDENNRFSMLEPHEQEPQEKNPYDEYQNFITSLNDKNKQEQPEDERFSKLELDESQEAQDLLAKHTDEMVQRNMFGLKRFLETSKELILYKFNLTEQDKQEFDITNVILFFDDLSDIGANKEKQLFNAIYRNDTKAIQVFIPIKSVKPQDIDKFMYEVEHDLSAAILHELVHARQFSRKEYLGGKTKKPLNIVDPFKTVIRCFNNLEQQHEHAIMNLMSRAETSMILKPFVNYARNFCSEHEIESYTRQILYLSTRNKKPVREMIKKRTLDELHYLEQSLSTEPVFSRFPQLRDAFSALFYQLNRQRDRQMLAYIDDNFDIK